MSKVIAVEYLSLDGVTEEPGWVAPDPATYTGTGQTS
jgi:hypothetical protein